MRVAIVGGGPRGLWAVEELARVASAQNLSCEVTIFDPQQLGRGAAYSLDQPAYYLLNVEADRVATGWGLLNEFRRQVLGERDPLTTFPPRRTVGLFFHFSWQHLLANLPTGFTVRHVQQRVTDISQLIDYDAVLSVTGHNPLPNGDGVLRSYGDLSAVAAGSSVALRGAALSCIDTVLALTLGRGGNFSGATYKPSGFEPATMMPFSRSGRFIQVKPPQPTESEVGLLEKFKAPLAHVTTGAELRAVIIEAASALHGVPLTWGDSLSTLPTEELMRVSLLSERLPQQSFGMVWKNLYPQIITRVSLGGLPLDRILRETISRLKPLTFGAPAAQMHRMLGLVEAGILDLSMMDRAQDIKADYLIDTVQSPAGLAEGSFNETLARASDADISQGYLRTDERGFVGTSSRWAVAGRVTEPYVLGNDTVSRHNHSIIPAWAEAVGGLAGSQRAAS